MADGFVSYAVRTNHSSVGIEPLAGGGDEVDDLALAQAEHELTAAGLRRRHIAPSESVSAGPFTLTAPGL